MGGIVYHSNYLKYCERARSELFFNKNKKPFNTTSSFVVKNIQANYILPCIMGDIIEVKTKISLMRKTSIKLNQAIYKNKEIIFDMDILLAFLKNGKPSKIEDYFLEVFRNLS